MHSTAHLIAGAALPVSIGLLLLTAAARLALWAPADSPRMRALAREYLARLSTWCLIATGVYTVAQGATGDAGVPAYALAAIVAGVALALRAPGTEPESEPERPPAAAPPVAPPPMAGRSLWAEPDDDTRTGLWTR